MGQLTNTPALSADKSDAFALDPRFPATQQYSAADFNPLKQRILENETDNMMGVATYAALRGLVQVKGAGQQVVVRGGESDGDGGEGTFRWHPTSTATDNGGTIIKVTSVTTGRWVRTFRGRFVLGPAAYVDAGWFILKPDNESAAASNVTALNAAEAAAGDRGILEIPAGTYFVTPPADTVSPLPLSRRSRLTILGYGAELKLKTGVLTTTSVGGVIRLMGMCSDITIKGLKINGNRAGQSAEHSEHFHGISAAGSLFTCVGAERSAGNLTKLYVSLEGKTETGFLVGDAIAWQSRLSYWQSPKGLGSIAAISAKSAAVAVGVSSVAATDDSFTATAHGFVADDKVSVWGIPESVAGVNATTLYYVIASGLTSNTFKLSTTQGGSSIDITVGGTVTVGKVQTLEFTETALGTGATGSILVNPGVVSLVNTGLLLEDVTITEATGDDLYLAGGMRKVTVRGGEFSTPRAGGNGGNARMGIGLECCEDVLVDGTVFPGDANTQNGSFAIDVEPNSGQWVKRVTIRDVRVTADFWAVGFGMNLPGPAVYSSVEDIKIERGRWRRYCRMINEADPATNVVRNVDFVGNEIEQSLVAMSMRSLRVQGNRAAGWDNDGIGDAAFYFDACSDTEITDNESAPTNSATGGVRIRNACKRVKVRRHTVVKPDTNTTLTTGVRVSSAVPYTVDADNVDDALDDLFTTTIKHRFAAGDQVAFRITSGSTGIDGVTRYYVIADQLTATTFKVSATLGGSAINITADGDGQVVKLANATAYTLEADDETFTATAHPFVDDDPIVLLGVTGGTGTTAGTVYYVRDKAANTFKVAAAPGGPVVGVTLDGSGTAYKIPDPAHVTIEECNLSGRSGANLTAAVDLTYVYGPTPPGLVVGVNADSSFVDTRVATPKKAKVAGRPGVREVNLATGVNHNIDLLESIIRYVGAQQGDTIIDVHHRPGQEFLVINDSTGVNSVRTRAKDGSTVIGTGTDNVGPGKSARLWNTGADLAHLSTAYP